MSVCAQKERESGRQTEDSPGKVSRMVASSSRKTQRRGGFFPWIFAVSSGDSVLTALLLCVCTLELYFELSDSLGEGEQLAGHLRAFPFKVREGNWRHQTFSLWGVHTGTEEASFTVLACFVSLLLLLLSLFFSFTRGGESQVE